MPGIFGIVAKNRGQELRPRFDDMVRSVERAPFYTSGTYINKQIGLWVGWTGLEGSIADPIPQWNEDGTIALFFSGEAITDPAKSGRLKTLGHQIESSATYHLVHLYEDEGHRFVKSLNGRFSGLIVDLRENRITLFNDRFGLERTYCHQAKDAFYFAAEAKAILGACPNLRQMDPIGFSETFSCGCALRNRTIFSGISLLPGASIWRFESGREATKAQYFQPGDWEVQETLSPSAYYERLKETWITILPRYMEGAIPMGMSLTGGKDSRMIMAWSHTPPGSLPCYTFGGMFRESQDVKLARKIARLCRQPHQVITLDQEFLRAFPGLAERTVFLTDGAMDVSGAAELFVNRLAREIAPLRLTGNYGQEILQRAVAFKPHPFNNGLLEPAFASLVRAAEGTYARELVGNTLSFIAFKQVPWHHRSRLSLELSQVAIRSPYLDNDLVALAYQRPLENATDDKIQLGLIAEGHPALASLDTDRGLLYGTAALPERVKRLLKGFSFKAEYAYDYGMPQTLAKIDKLLKPLHPERFILGRNKYYHYRVWYRDQLSGYIREILLDHQTRKRSFLEGRRLEAMVSSHVRGTGNFTSEIHRLLTAELIHRQFFD
jgi:asparagine synthase (glutamine-hydrolysing)